MIATAGWEFTDKMESTERKENYSRRYDETKLYRAEDKYVRPLVLQLFVITAKHTHYVTLQLRLAALVVIWWRTSCTAFGCREPESDCFTPFFHLQTQIQTDLFNRLRIFLLLTPVALWTFVYGKNTVTATTQLHWGVLMLQFAWYSLYNWCLIKVWAAFKSSWLQDYSQ